MCHYCDARLYERAKMPLEVDFSLSGRKAYVCHKGRNEWIIETSAYDGEDSADFVLRYCPMCGRKLRKGGEA